LLRGREEDETSHRKRKSGRSMRHHEGSSQHKISEMPNSRATCAIDLPLVWASCTASRLNSAVEIFCPFCMILVLLLEESLRRFYPSTNSGQDHDGPERSVGFRLRVWHLLGNARWSVAVS